MREPFDAGARPPYSGHSTRSECMRLASPSMRSRSSLTQGIRLAVKVRWLAMSERSESNDSVACRLNDAEALRCGSKAPILRAFDSQ